MTGIVATPEDFPFAFQHALNGGDLERIVALYDDAAVLRVQSGEVRSGTTAVRAEMRQLVAADAEIANTLRHSLRHGDVALIVVDYVLRLRAPDGSPVVLTGTAANVIRNTPANGWRMIIANPQGLA